MRKYLIKPLINHYDEGAKSYWDPVWANAIYQLFIAAGSTLFQGLLEAEDVRLSFETLEPQSTVGKIDGYNPARVKVWWTYSY